MIQRMKQELIWNGDQFLITYKTELNELYSNQHFMQIIRNITKCQLFPESKVIIDQLKTEVKNCFFQKGLSYEYDALKRIEDDAKKNRYTAASAHISVFIAMWIFDIQNNTSFRVTFSELDFRKKWEAKYRCSDGHYVRSKNEVLVDNWLYLHDICHSYEKAVFGENGEEYYSDFYIPSIELYVEIWGLADEEYTNRITRKKGTYTTLGYNLLEITGNDITHLDDILEKEILSKITKKH